MSSNGAVHCTYPSDDTPFASGPNVFVTVALATLH